MKHGKWLADEDKYEICATEFTCSVCGETFCSSELTDKEFIEQTLYCPHCGARMGGVDRRDECGVYDDEGNKVTVCACGTEISPHSFEVADECYGETHKVQVLRCKNCGKLSFGWWSL